MWIIMSVTIISIVLLSFFFIKTEASSYRWSASIDRSTGVARSRESSTIPSTSQLAKQPSAQAIFSCYPQWLCTGKVSLGLLKARTQQDGSTFVQDRIFGLDLLKFGKRKCMGNNSICLPITGGIMALSDDGRNYGSLVFSIIQEGKMMETEIDHGYRPTIAGKAPVSYFRAWTYRSSQSLLHAYVMWRFHGYCYNAIAPLE
jgi:hypothetical protein